MVGFLGLAWIAFVVGVVVGWAWKPKWAGGGRDKLACFPVPKMVFVLNFRINSFKLRRTISGPWGSGNKVDKEPLVAAPPVNDANCSVSRATSEESFVMPERESKHLYQLVELKDGGPAWVKMMDQSTPNMGYQAWRRDPEAVPYPSIPRCTKPRCVDLYRSSWCIRAAESRKGNEQLTACEVIVFHHEDMGIPREVVKLAVRQGIWGAVRKIEHGLRGYQKS